MCLKKHPYEMVENLGLPKGSCPGHTGRVRAPACACGSRGLGILPSTPVLFKRNSSNIETSSSGWSVLLLHRSVPTLSSLFH